MPPRLNVEDRVILTYLRRRVRESLQERHGDITGRVIFKQRYGTLDKIVGDFKKFVDLSGRHIQVVADRIISLGKSLGFGFVTVRLVAKESP